MYYTYLLICKDGSIYTGITRDVAKRFYRHANKQGARYTQQRKAAEVVYTEKYNTKIEAAKRERQIKGWRKEKKLNLIKFGKPNP